MPEPWISFLAELDSAVETEVRLDCMGGFVVTMVYGFSRPTADLDVLEIAPREASKPMLQLGMQGGPLHKKYKIYLDPVGVVHVPENYEDRLTEIFPEILPTSSSLRPRSLRPGAVEVGAQHSTGPGRREISGRRSPARSGSADRAISERTALAARQSEARGLDAQTVD